MASDPVLGHELFGAGARPVIVLNDWLCDTSTWDGARVYLDPSRVTWAFVDLRGYGRSRGRTGAFTVRECASDVLAVAGAHGWSRFAVVGHSMSSLVALHLAQHHADRIACAVAITPPPPTGFGADEAMLAASRALARGDDAMRAEILLQRFGDRLSPGWGAHKAARWRATADPDAAAAYVAMFARDGLPEPENAHRGAGARDHGRARCAADARQCGHARAVVAVRSARGHRARRLRPLSDARGAAAARRARRALRRGVARYGAAAAGGAAAAAGGGMPAG